MPNWCHNKLAVVGNPDDVMAFINKVQRTEGEDATALTFQAHVPQPDDIDNYADTGLGGGWYSWCVDHWGTKWDANTTGPGVALGTSEALTTIDQTAAAWALVDGGAMLTFDTAWAPPNAWLRTTAIAEPQLRFVMRYADAGSDFAGEVRVEGEKWSEISLEVEDVLGPEEMWF